MLGEHSSDVLEARAHGLLNLPAATIGVHWEPFDQLLHLCADDLCCTCLKLGEVLAKVTAIHCSRDHLPQIYLERHRALNTIPRYPTVLKKHEDREVRTSRGGAARASLARVSRVTLSAVRIPGRRWSAHGRP